MHTNVTVPNREITKTYCFHEAIHSSRRIPFLYHFIIVAFLNYIDRINVLSWLLTPIICSQEIYKNYLYTVYKCYIALIITNIDKKFIFTPNTLRFVNSFG